MVTRAGPDRYRLLDTLRAYALDVLAELDADPARERHARFYVELAEQGETGVRGHGQLVWLNRLRADINNFRAAVDWSLLTGNVEGAAPPGRRVGVVLDPQRHADGGDPAAGAPRRH